MYFRKTRINLTELSWLRNVLLFIKFLTIEVGNRCRLKLTQCYATEPKADKSRYLNNYVLNSLVKTFYFLMLHSIIFIKKWSGKITYYRQA